MFSSETTRSELIAKVEDIIERSSVSKLRKVLKFLEKEHDFPFEILPRLLLDRTVYGLDTETGTFVMVNDRIDGSIVSSEELPYPENIGCPPDVKFNGVSYYSQTIKIPNKKRSLNHHSTDSDSDSESDDMSDVFTSFFTARKEEPIITIPVDDCRLFLISPDLKTFVIDNHSTGSLETWEVSKNSTEGKMTSRFKERRNEYLITKLDDNSILVDVNKVILITCEGVMFIDFSGKKLKWETIEDLPYISGNINVCLRLSSSRILLHINNIFYYFQHIDGKWIKIQEIRNKSFPCLLPPAQSTFKEYRNILELNISDDLKNVILNYLISDYNNTSK
jgi:hypothetical protein